MKNLHLQPGAAQQAPANSGIFSTRGKAPSVFPSLPPSTEEHVAERVGYYHDILNTLPEIAFETDSHGRITFINDTALRAFGMSREEADGREFTALMPEGGAAERLRAALDGVNPGPLEYEMRRHDGVMMHVRCTLTIITHEGGVIGLRGIATDMSETAWMQKELEKAERRRASYESAARSGHDLRNVLCALQGGASFLQTFDFNNLSATDIRDIRETLKDQIEAIERGTKMTDDMMQLASADRMSWSAVDLTGMIETIMRERRPACAAKDIVQMCEVEPIILAKADRHKLHRALDNIVSNAIDSMEKGGLLEITAGYGIFEGRQAARISIRDTGCGIPDNMLDAIFEPFVTMKGQKGTGLGLAIAAAVVDSHNGTISVRSEEGNGTTFDIVIPSG